MTDFLLKSALSMGLLLAVYHLFLEREKMHRFNRFYLLFALVFSLALPFITFTVYKEVAAGPQPVFDESINLIAPVTQAEQSTDYTTPLLWSLYAAITLVLAIKFAKNLYHFTKQARKSPSQKLGNATLVLMDEKVIPHTFLNYIFVSKDEYEQNGIEQELYTHELAHVKQKHSFDILFIEVLKTVLWFNPLLYLYKKAIQLNHEFLADETVVTTSQNIITYQQLLLQKAVPATAYQLASSLNFSVTKKRLNMMTKATPKGKALLFKLMALPVIAGLVYALCIETVAQTTKAEKLPGKVTRKSVTKKDTAARDWYYDGVTVRVLDSNKFKILHKPYKELTDAEKDTYLPPLPEQLQKTPPTAKQFEDLKKAVKSSVSIDFKDVDHNEILKYKAADFAIYLADFPVKGPLQRNQCILITNNYYNKNFRDKHETFGYNIYTAIMLKDEKTGMLKPEMVPNQIGATMFLKNRPKIKAADAAKNIIVKAKRPK